MAQTNADSIRSMSNVDLARYLHQICFSRINFSYENWLEFLNRPAKYIGPSFRLADIYKIRLLTWIFDHRSMFEESRDIGQCFGKNDESYVYITNKAFQSFCILNNLDPTDVLRVLFAANYILTRQGFFHGGYYKTTRIAHKLESCVWLIKDAMFKELEACFNG